MSVSLQALIYAVLVIPAGILLVRYRGIAPRLHDALNRRVPRFWRDPYSPDHLRFTFTCAGVLFVLFGVAALVAAAVYWGH